MNRDNKQLSYQIIEEHARKKYQRIFKNLVSGEGKDPELARLKLKELLREKQQERGEAKKNISHVIQMFKDDYLSDFLKPLEVEEAKYNKIRRLAEHLKRQVKHFYEKTIVIIDDQGAEKTNREMQELAIWLFRQCNGKEDIGREKGIESRLQSAAYFRRKYSHISHEIRVLKQFINQIDNGEVIAEEQKPKMRLAKEEIEKLVNKANKLLEEDPDTYEPFRKGSFLGNNLKSELARELELSESALYERLKKYCHKVNERFRIKDNLF